MMSRKLILISCGVIKTMEHDFAVVLCSIRRSSFRNHQFLQVCVSFDFLRRKLRENEGGSFFGSERLMEDGVAGGGPEMTPKVKGGGALVELGERNKFPGSAFLIHRDPVFRPNERDQVL